MSIQKKTISPNFFNPERNKKNFNTLVYQYNYYFYSITGGYLFSNSMIKFNNSSLLPQIVVCLERNIQIQKKQSPQTFLIWREIKKLYFSEYFNLSV